MATPPVFSPGHFLGRRSLVGHSPLGHKESDGTERLTHTSFVSDSKHPMKPPL